jgi:hypothetical protein
MKGDWLSFERQPHALGGAVQIAGDDIPADATDARHSSCQKRGSLDNHQNSFIVNLTLSIVCVNDLVLFPDQRGALGDCLTEQAGGATTICNHALLSGAEMIGVRPRHAGPSQITPADSLMARFNSLIARFNSLFDRR